MDKHLQCPECGASISERDLAAVWCMANTHGDVFDYACLTCGTVIPIACKLKPDFRVVQG